MLTEVRKHLYLLKRYFSFNLQSAMEYKVNFLIQSVGMMLNNVTFILFWWILFHKMGNEIGGYQFQQMMVIWAIGSAGFGLSIVLFGNASRLTRLIIDGQLDAYLLQPKNVLWNILISRTSISGWGDVLYGIILYAFAVPLTLLNWVLFIGFMISAAFLFTAVMVFANTLTFYLGRASALSNLVPEFVLTLSIYPEGIFSGLIRFLLYTLLPAGFISYIPVRILSDFSWTLIGYIIAFDLVFVLLAFWFFHQGLKKYESGNLMQSRV